jgi:hypothetical protein
MPSSHVGLVMRRSACASWRPRTGSGASNTRPCIHVPAKSSANTPANTFTNTLKHANLLRATSFPSQSGCTCISVISKVLPGTTRAFPVQAPGKAAAGSGPRAPGVGRGDGGGHGAKARGRVCVLSLCAFFVCICIFVRTHYFDIITALI